MIGGGLVGCAVLHALTRRGVQATLLEAEPGLALGASGTNSGILHTGFDSTPGALETRLILRAGELREQLLGELGVEAWRCGARMQPRGDQERDAVAQIAENARANGVEVSLDGEGALQIPGESVTDPVAFAFALADAAQLGGAGVRLGTRVCGLERESARIALALAGRGGEQRLRASAVVNCAGLFADDLARMAGEEGFSIYPRKGEFLVFAMPRADPLREILLPVPSSMGKGVLVFPTIDRLLIAGPSAREREDKHDWSVEADAQEIIRARAERAYPPLAVAQSLGAYAGLRPAGRAANYVIERSRTLPGLVHVAAIRSTGLSAALGIGEYVAALLERSGAVELGPERRLQTPTSTYTAPADGWWTRAARHHEAADAAGGVPAS